MLSFTRQNRDTIQARQKTFTFFATTLPRTICTKFYHNRSGFVECISKDIQVFFGSQCIYQTVQFFIQSKTAVSYITIFKYFLRSFRNIFCGKQDAIKVNNVIVAHWLNILCKRIGVSNGVIAISTTLTYQRSCLPAFSSTGIYRPRKLAREYAVPQSS